MLNDRKVPRRTIRARVGLLVKGVYSLNWTRELGEGGMLIEIDQELNAGDSVLITFKIPMGSHIVVRAELRNRPDAHSAGFQFMDLDFATKRAIRNYVVSPMDDGPGAA